MQEIIIFIIGLVAGFLGATVGGGGMISIPALLFLGFPPQSAIAINKVGDVGTFISAIRQYWKSKKIDWKMAVPLAIIAVIGSIIGTQIMVRLETNFLGILIGIILLLFLPFFFFSRKIGIKQKNPSKTKKIIGIILYFILAIEGAMVGAGGAAILLLIMMYFFGYEIIKGYATNTPAEFFSALVPAIIYSFYGFVQLLPAIIIF
ncbi:sulfite exporter TauE/SafE family protein, partial [Candidatus Micrarchaeota archaeon]|nr:sulfite exporter TauE/SafE family protein [Candidatus Micrarchaeota archaeon]MBU1930083.1 sulfite exporter TauE/SafE family protein [Candidatus Micrarchaeota archaeon]